VQTGKLLEESDKESGHKKTITALTKSADGSHFLTGSLDKSAKVLISQSIFSILSVVLFIIIYIYIYISTCSYLFCEYLALGQPNFDSYQDVLDRTSSQCSCNVSTS
jgi:hypothetical protein